MKEGTIADARKRVEAKGTPVAIKVSNLYIVLGNEQEAEHFVDNLESLMARSASEKSYYFSFEMEE